MKVGFIGTGLMGLPMAQRLLATGVELVAYNRTSAKLAPLQATGAAIASHPFEVMRDSECVILMLTDAAAIRSVVLSESAQQYLAGRTVIQMGTISATDSRAISAEVVAAGGDYLEAPVLGSIPEAKTGKLIVMVGGTSDQFQRWLQLLQHFGPEPLLIGPVGSAAAVKLALNQLIASLTAAFSLSLGLIQHEQINVDTFMQILRHSALYAPTFDKKLQRMLEGNYANPNFSSKHLLKDTDLFISEAEAAGLNVSSIEGVRKILNLTLAHNLADADYCSLNSVINPVHLKRGNGVNHSG